MHDQHTPDDLDFDHQSPDVDDPQVDPPEPATAPADEGSDSDYPPYDKQEK